MVYAIIKVTGSYAITVHRNRIPAGIIGAKVLFEFGAEWENRRRTVVFKAGDVAKDVLLSENQDTVDIPPEVVSEPCSGLRVGVYGTDGSGTALPTLWADLGRVYEATDPSGDESTDPSLPVWAQIREEIQEMKDNPPSGGPTDLEGYATEQWVKDQNYLTKVPEGYAKTADIPKNPEDIGAQPSGDYALRSEIPAVPVRSVNGKTGAVQLSASDVGARSDNWMPTAQDVGALPATYTPPDQTAEQVGADPKGTAASAVSQHNTADDSHQDIRLELAAINARLTAFFDSDDQTLDELSEIVAYITSNKTLIQAITTSKVSVTDIVDNLTTSLANKPLSAAQGVVLRVMIDAVNTKLSRYALKTEIPTKVSQLENDSGYLKEHQDISGLLPRTELPAAIDTALAQAKDSGEFDGKDGQDGDDGVSPTVTASAIAGGHRITITDKSGTKTVDVMDGSPGKNGNGIKSAILNADYTLTLTFDDGKSYTTPSIRGATGQTGQPGGKGDPGTSVTVKSVTESTADGGSNVVEFSDGKTVTIKNGKKGADGKNPVKGVDYWTDADQEAMVQQVLTALGTPVFGRVEEGNKITISTEHLADGTYYLGYEDKDGNWVEIGTLDHNGEDEPTYTNLLPLAINSDNTPGDDSDNTPYIGTNGEKGYKTNTRLNSSGVESTSNAEDIEVTGFMPVTENDTVYFSGITWPYDGERADRCYFAVYDNEFTKITSQNITREMSKYGVTYDSQNNITSIAVASYIGYFNIDSTNIAYFRISAVEINDNSIITVNEPIS